MPISITIPTKKCNIEVKCELSFKRKREDIKQVLLKLKEGNKLNQLFPSPIASSLHKQFIENGYIDSLEILQENGIKFLENPFRSEKERSIYSIDLVEFDIAGYKRQMVVNITRKLSNEEREINHSNPFDSIISNNELLINNEKIYFDALNNISKDRAYIGKVVDYDVIFDVTNNLYNAGFGFKESGNIKAILKKFVKETIDSSQNYLIISDNLDSIIVKSIKDFEDKDLLNGSVSSLKFNNGYQIEIVNVPMIINDYKVAVEYAYFYMYYKISDGEYLSINEMNELFENELLSKSIYTDSVKLLLSGFSYSEDGFNKYLEKSKYEDMSYKLNVMKTLLDVEIKDTRIKNVRSYNELLNYISNVVSPNDVKNVSLVLGYATARTIKNKIIDCIEAFQTTYKGGVEIIAKNDGSGQKTDDSIKESILNHGVPLKVNFEIGKNFHDRYIVFSMKDGTYKCMLATNEVGQFFNIETNEPLGSIMLISNDEIVKSGKSLITMVKEAK